MVFYILLYICICILKSLQQNTQSENIIKILVDKSFSPYYFYINSSFDNHNSKIIPLKIELNTLSTSVVCNYISPNYLLNSIKSNPLDLPPESLNDFTITCSDNICYKLFYDENICENSSKNKCSYNSLYKYYHFYQSDRGVYIKYYFNPFINGSSSLIKEDNLLPIGCIENHVDSFNGNITSGIFSLGGDSYSFLAHFYKENNFGKNNTFFSICLDPDEGGYLTMGGDLTLTEKYHINTDSPINFKYDVKHSFYVFEVNNFFFNHESFNKEKYKAILNTNSEYTYLNKKIINDLYTLFKKYLTDELLKRYQLDLTMNQNENDTLDMNRICFVNNNPEDYQFKQKLYLILPPLYIGIGNNYYKWTSEYYLNDLYGLDNIKNKNELCVGILSNENKNKDDIVEFGANFMFGHELMFDFIKKEITVHESNCSMKPKSKINIKLESKYEKMNKIMKIIVIVMIIFIVFLIFVICRLRRRRGTLCIKFLGKEVTNEEINQFFNTNYNFIK